MHCAKTELVQGKGAEETVRKLELVMQQAGVTPEICPAVAAALDKAEATGAPAGAMVLPVPQLFIFIVFQHTHINFAPEFVEPIKQRIWK